VSVVCAAASAQTPDPAFEVASIKPSRADVAMVNLSFEPGGRFVATNVSLQMLIGLAYGDGAPLPPNRIIVNAAWIGGGPYMTATRYDINAKADGNPSRSQLPILLRSLLADRFTLVVHHENRDLPVYVLRIDRADGRLGRDLRRSTLACNPDGRPASPPGNAATGFAPAGCGFRSVPGRTAARGVPIRDLARLMTGWVDDHRPVEDETGLEGNFDIDLEWATDQPLPANAPPMPPANPNAPSLFTALREQLGLRAEPGKRSEEILVVDHAERPTPD
jgi:uncharacterized protein (TIGR03435 family)